MQITELQHADIILTARSFKSSKVSTVIMAGTASEFSHAMIFVGNGQVVEAISDGVKQNPVGVAIHDTSSSVVFRHSQVDSAKAKKICEFAISKLDGEYAVPGVLTGSGIFMATSIGVLIAGGRYVANKVKESTGKKRSYFCSELVTDAYLNGGIVLGRYGRTPSMMNPGDIAEYSDRNPSVLKRLGSL